ncbi:hypothetical protein BT67DRAFT_206649 [Trichocladium antarcticum]|uniref:Uncharacterized protein n=1 Tax=Trichocladium antarcticum TaxID=1450529 RepID=A0AAN6UFQ3_9PEZI|nr:hypothetical protein BT67DRAFT_206649 [Trichocladium antarcticum]
MSCPSHPPISFPAPLVVGGAAPLPTFAFHTAHFGLLPPPTTSTTNITSFPASCRPTPLPDLPPPPSYLT